MSERPPVGRLLDELRRELRGLGPRRRRQVLDELHDHLLSAIEDERADGASAFEAERRAVARFGDARVIASRLRETRGRRGRRAVRALTGAAAITALLALAGSLGQELAPRSAAAASLPGPSVHGCAQAFDGPSNLPGRARLGTTRVLAVEIFPTPLPSCVIRFQLPEQRVLTAVAAWTSGTASSWRITIRAPGRVAGSNARWAAGKLTATGSGVTRIVRLGPAPSTASCVAAWNARTPPSAPAFAPRPVLVRPLARGAGIFTWDRTSSTTLDGPGCTVSMIGVAHETTLFYSPWDEGRAVGWIRPPGASGILGEPVPNADLIADGRLRLR